METVLGDLAVCLIHPVLPASAMNSLPGPKDRAEGSGGKYVWESHCGNDQ
ncbi:MAG TPA: hypothetical protein PK878_07470 [bacterium]|nr:hypothetical protein [bacterium]